MTLRLDKAILNLLDALELKHDAYNKKMLGILTNNIISKTITTCDEIDRYNINIIDIDDIHELNTKKSLQKEKYIICNEYNDKIKFKYE
ncbi:hypothetical protein CE11_00061 [Megavirus courdo11]|uniref:Uncharacterized protein n=1 Tax=Megavirus courdo11 TaxID=1128140 RepID=K7YV14_9VIRU|nr:hypothetical protein CE11_00061 [Megavirus courdo11]